MPATGNLVHETSTSTGTGAFTLANADGRQSFNDRHGTGGMDVFYYFISHRTAAEWEVGTGHLSASDTLVRDTVIESSNSDAVVNFSAGTKDVTSDIEADNTKAELQWNGETYVLPTHRCALWMNILIRPVINAACRREAGPCGDEPRAWTPWGYMP